MWTLRHSVLVLVLTVTTACLPFVDSGNAKRKTAAIPTPTPTVVIIRPSSTPPPQPTPVPVTAQKYTVKAGDTLSGIAQRFGVPMDAIAKANNLSDPNRLQIGQELVIPAQAPAQATPTPAGPSVVITPTPKS